MSKFGSAITGNSNRSLLGTPSIDKDAFIYQPFLKSLHIALARKIPVDLKHMLNLKELCLQNIFYIQANLPTRLEKLDLIDLDVEIDLEPLKALTELKFWEIAHVKSILFNSSQPFDGFSKLTCLKLSESCLKFDDKDSNKGSWKIFIILLFYYYTIWLKLSW